MYFSESPKPMTKSYINDIHFLSEKDDNTLNNDFKMQNLNPNEKMLVDKASSTPTATITTNTTTTTTNNLSNQIGVLQIKKNPTALSTSLIESSDNYIDSTNEDEKIPSKQKKERKHYYMI